MKCFNPNCDQGMVTRTMTFDEMQKAPDTKLARGALSFAAHDPQTGGFVVRVMCLDCNGSGQAHCCDGICEQPEG